MVPQFDKQNFKSQNLIKKDIYQKYCQQSEALFYVFSKPFGEKKRKKKRNNQIENTEKKNQGKKKTRRAS